MPLYRIEQYELHSQSYQVEAASAAQAVKDLFEGKATPVDNSLEFIEVSDDFGLPADEHQNLAEELQQLGVVIKEGLIPSIRSIEGIEGTCPGETHS